MKLLSEQQFKSQFKKDSCSNCALRIPCNLTGGICEKVAPCPVCPIQSTCSSLCQEMRAYLNRGLQRQPDTIPLTDSIQSSMISLEPKGEFKFSITDIPWGCINTKDKFIIEEHFIRGRTIKEISRQLQLHPDTVYKKIKGNKKRKGLLGRLKEFAYYNNLLKQFGRYIPNELRSILDEYYIKCKKLQVIAENNNQSIGKTHALLVMARKSIRKYEE